MKKALNASIKHVHDHTISILEKLLGYSIDDKTLQEVCNSESFNTFLSSLPTDLPENYLTPQWVVLAAGKGTRIDPTGKMSKTLDIMLGEHNMLQLSRRYLPGNRQDIIIINPQMASRIEEGSPHDKLLGSNAITCIQEKMNGTGGALQAAVPMLKESNAEWVGVSFGDEPFLEKKIFAQTLLSHFLSGADVTLCGKIPETVEDKGGLFFDVDRKLMCTKEWYDMSEPEQDEMWQRFEHGEAFTNTGITIIRKKVLLDRIDRLQPHPNRNNELHHVDLIRYCYEDELKTNAFIYKGEVLSGVNRWSNVLTGEHAMFEQTRKILTRKGVRVDPSAQITMADDEITIGSGCYLLGRIHIGEQVQIGDYCRLENVMLQGNTSVGDSVGLHNVNAQDTLFQSNILPTNLVTPVYGLNTESQIKDSTFDTVTVGNNVQLTGIHAHATVIPSDILLENERLGVPLAQSPIGVPTTLFNQIIPTDYRPGVYTFGEKKDLPDWENLRNHMDSHSAAELIPRSTNNNELQKSVGNAVRTLLDMRRANGDYLIESLTPEEVWGTIFEMVKIHTGNQNPYHQDKIKARQTALELLPVFWSDNWLTRLKLVVAGNIIDYSSARVVEKVNSNPNYFSQALSAAVETPFAIDCYELFKEKVIDAPSQQILWLADNDGEIIFDVAFIQDLIKYGHGICIVGKVENASNDVTLADLHDICNFPQFEAVQRAIQEGVITLMSSGAKTIGTNLFRAAPEFVNALLDTDIVISKGQGNFFTTPGWKKDTFYLLLSKGLTAERSTGVVADRDLPVDGLILAYLQAGTKRDATLKDLCNI